MPRYRILHKYSSGDFGPFEKGTEVELTEEQADWLLHDSPGVLEEIDPKAQQEAKRAANAERAKAYEAKADSEAEKTPARRRGRPPKSAGGGS